MSKKNYEDSKWGIKEIVTGVILSLLGVIALFGGAMLTMFNAYAMNIASGAFGVFFAAPVFILMTVKVNRFGSTALFATVLSISFISQGGFFVFFIPFYFVGGLLLDFLFLNKESKRKNINNLSLVWSIFSGLYLLSTFASMIDLHSYIDVMIQRGISQKTIDTFLNLYTNPIIVICILGFTIFSGYLGSLIGKRMLKRHFRNLLV